MRAQPFTSAELYGISSEDYRDSFSIEELKSIVYRYALDVSLLTARLKEIRTFYREGKPSLTHIGSAQPLSMEDVEALLENVQHLKTAKESAYIKWADILKRRKVGQHR